MCVCCDVLISLVCCSAGPSACMDGCAAAGPLCVWHLTQAGRGSTVPRPCRHGRGTFRGEPETMHISVYLCMYINLGLIFLAGVRVQSICRHTGLVGRRWIADPRASRSFATHARALGDSMGP